MEHDSYLFVVCVRVTGKFNLYMRKGKKASILRLPIAFTHPNGILKMFVFYQLKALWNVATKKTVSKLILESK